MDSGNTVHSSSSRESACPRCGVCGKVVRTRGVGRVGVWCPGCLGRTLPFVHIEAESDFRGALRDFREGLGSRAGEFEGLRFDPFGDEERGALGNIDASLRNCSYTSGDELRNRLREGAAKEGCSLSLLFHNIRSAKGPGLELLEAELRRWGVKLGRSGLG